MAKRLVLAVLGGLLAVGLLGAQTIKGGDFKDKEIRDILQVLGELNAVTIVPDETVEGRASYFFAVGDFETALKTFLDAFNLFYEKRAGVYYVSKVRITWEAASGKLGVSATEVPLRSILRLLVKQTAKTVFYDNLPNDPVTINMQDVTIETFLKGVIAKYPDFSLEKLDNLFQLRRKAADGFAARPGERGKTIVRSGELYSINADKARFRDTVIDLFAQAKQEFVFLLDRDMSMENVFLTGKSFEDMLKVLLLYGNADYTVSKGVYYIYEVQRRDLMKKYLVNQIYNLQAISGTELIKVLPSSLSSSSQMRIDEKGNRIILSGSLEEISPLLDFIRSVDKAGQGLKPSRIDLRYVKADEVIPLLPPDLASFSPLALPGKTAFLLTIPDNRRPDLDKFLAMADKPVDAVPIRLKYLKTDDFFAQLPPSVTEANFTKTKDASLVFFKGSEDLRQVFLRELASLDVPKPQIRYELFVFQNDASTGLDTSAKYGGPVGTQPGTQAVSGTFDKLLGINFDVVSTMGFNFGASLSAKLNTSTSKVLADTTLNGLSGEKISFQNTVTTRYPEEVAVPGTTTGATTTVFRELSSGLMINFEGWISGDKMITMKIDTSLSKRTDSGSTTNKDTSEKKITSNIRTKSGQPVIIAGLRQEDKSVSIDKVPFLGDIPWLGLLFQNRSEKVVETEVSIYLVPHLEPVQTDDYLLEDRVDQIYQRLAKLR